MKKLREKGLVPAVLYGPELKEEMALSVSEKEFAKIFKEAGESSIIQLEVGGEEKGSIPVLIREVVTDATSDKIVHIDFYQPRLKEEVEATVSLVFEGVSPAVKKLNGNLIKSFSEVEVRALPLELPHEIKVNLRKLETFNDNILVKDLIVPKGVKILRDPEEVIATVVPYEEEVIEEKKEPIAAEAEAPKEQKAEGVEAASKGGEPRPNLFGREKKEN